MARRKRPRPAAQACPEPDCPALIIPPADRCTAGHSTAGRGWEPDSSRGSREARGYDTAWRRTRIRIIRRDAGRCQQCGTARPPLTVDHRRPRWAGGTDADANLWTLCQPCHRRKTAAEAAEVRRHRGRR